VFYYSQTSGNDHVFLTNIMNSYSTPALVIKDAGDVGIGTNSPSTHLNVFGSGTQTTLIESSTAAGEADVFLKTTGGAFDYLGLIKKGPSAGGTVAGISVSNLSMIYAGMQAGPMLIDVMTSNPLYFATNNLERMIITPSGIVGINNNAPSVNNQLQVTTSKYTAGYFTSDNADALTHVIDAEYNGAAASLDLVAVYGKAIPSDGWGIGGSFEGGFVGAQGVVNATGSGAYDGLKGIASGGSGLNYGIFASASGSSAINYAVYGTASSGAGTSYGGYFTTTAAANQYSLRLDGDFYNQQTSMSSIVNARVATVLKNSAAVLYRTGSSVIVQAYYSATCSSGSDVYLKLTRWDGSTETPIAYSATSPYSTGNAVSASIVFRDVIGLVDGTNYTYRLYVSSAATLTVENSTVVPMLIKE
jgi:hypothetical protein